MRDHEDIEESYDGDDSQRRDANITKEEATVYVKKFDLLVKVPAVLSLGKLFEDHGYTSHRTSGQKPHLTNTCKNMDCNISIYVPFVVLGSLHHPQLLPQHLHRRIPYLTRRSGSPSEELRGSPLHRSAETENT